MHTYFLKHFHAVATISDRPQELSLKCQAEDRAANKLSKPILMRLSART